MDKKEIREARESLRDIYTEYTNELYKIVFKIDKALGVIECQKQKTEKE